MKSVKHKRTTASKISLFRSFFSGLPHVYGTYDVDTRRSWQVKESVTTKTILDHLKGNKHFGLYLLVNDTFRAIAADFDNHDPTNPLDFIRKAGHYRLPAYLEISKSKGFHVWIFFRKGGVKAYKARLVVKAILEEIKAVDTEVFPKQDVLDSQSSYGNFIYTPLFGRLVPEGRTVFVKVDTLKAFEDQWKFLETIQKVDEALLDEVIDINNLSRSNQTDLKEDSSIHSHVLFHTALPPCIQSMLQIGVRRFQRSSCFRIAVQLRKTGLPFDTTLAVLQAWSLKNKPEDGKRIITAEEIMEQTLCAYRKYYSAYGCEAPEMKPFCHPKCSRRNRF